MNGGEIPFYDLHSLTVAYETRQWDWGFSCIDDEGISMLINYREIL